MAKIIVKRAFYDRETGDLRREGDVAEYRDERADELEAGGFAERVRQRSGQRRKRG